MINMILKRTICIDIDDKVTKVGIIDSILGKKNIKLLTDISNKETMKLNSTYVENLTKNINNIISKHLTPFSSLVFTLQDETIITRNIKIINPKDKKDIKDLIKYELKNFMAINLDNYRIKFIITNTLEKELEVQVILFPKSSIELCKEISKSLKIKPKKIYVNFNVLQNLIYKNIIDIDDGENLILEVKSKIINLNVVKNKNIIESYSLSKSNDIYRYIEPKLRNLNKVYTYGMDDINLIEMINNISTVEKLRINSLDIKNENNYLLSEFINNIGMIY